MSKSDTTTTSRAGDLQKEWTESPEHPQNWPDRQRWTIALVIALTGFLVNLPCFSVAWILSVRTDTNPVSGRARPTRPFLSPTFPSSRRATTRARKSRS